MIRYNAQFILFDSPHVKVPRNLRQHEKFWCSFNTKNNLIMCCVIYLGDDEVMLQNKWYNGVIELPYGEKYPPVSKISDNFQDLILLNATYDLNVASQIVGQCKLIAINEIIYNDFDVNNM